MFVQFDEIETLVGDIFGQQETQKGTASEGASLDDEGKQQERDDGEHQGGQEESGEVGPPVLIQNHVEEIDWSVRPEFMIYQHPNGYIQHWLIETPAIPWGDPCSDHLLESPHPN